MDVDLLNISNVDRLDVLSLLLGCVYNTEVYDPSAEDDEAMLEWFSSVVDWILSLDARLTIYFV